MELSVVNIKCVTPAQSRILYQKLIQNHSRKASKIFRFALTSQDIILLYNLF